MQKAFKTLKMAVKDFFDDECMVSGSSLAYYTIFSLPPLLVLVFFVAGLFQISDEKVNKVVSNQIGIPVTQSVSGSDSEAETETEGESTTEETNAGGSLQSVAERKSSSTQPMKQLGPVSKVIGVLLLIFSATGLFAQLQRALNKAWEVEPDPQHGGWKNFILKRALSLGMIAVVAFLLLVSLVLTTLVDEFVQLAVGENPGAVGTAIGIVLNNIIVLLMATVLFASMFKTLPDAVMRWRDMWIGAFATAMLFVIGKSLIGWYLQNSELGSAWGSAASSMIALLVWVYYTSIIVLFGAELTQAWATEFGDGIRPEKGAVRVVERTEHVRRGQRSAT